MIKNPRILIALTVLFLATFELKATPPYKDPNQPYDRLPGTLETYHVKWSKPGAAGKLNVLFIIPYANSREVVESAQRLDMDYTVIMNSGNSTWADGYHEGVNATPLKGAEASSVLNKLAKQRLNMAHRYDAIVIAKISWEVLPQYVKDLTLKHVERGSGLVYVSPNRLQKGLSSKKETSGADKTFDELFKKNDEKDIADKIIGSLPFDAMPLHILKKRSDYKPILAQHRLFYAQSPLCITARAYGKGRIIALDYLDASYAFRKSASLSYFYNNPEGTHDKVIYDYAFAILTKAMLWSAKKEAPARASIKIKTPMTKLKAPIDKVVLKRSWENKTPETLIERKRIPESEATLSVFNQEKKSVNLKFNYSIRNMKGEKLQEKSFPVTVKAQKDFNKKIKLPYLGRGTYFLDLRVLNSIGAVVDFASRSFRIETANFVKEVRTEKEAYKKGETLKGSLFFEKPLASDALPSVKAVDTWGQTVAEAVPVLSGDRLSASFSFPVKYPLSRLWDIVGEISDKHGEVASAQTVIGIPNWTFDDYVLMHIFAPYPGAFGWKGFLCSELMRKYGLNGSFTELIHSNLKQYELNARSHLQSISFAEHIGEMNSPADRSGDFSKERKDLDMAEWSRMCRYIKDTGKKLDPKKYPYKLGHVGADFINSRIKKYQASAKFGSPFYVLTGENYLSGEYAGLENSGFGPTTTKEFQKWTRKEYKNDIAALNKEWNTDFKDWSEVRGILLQEAVGKNQLSRWVDFRYFMRSCVWSQFFIDWTDMIRKYVPEVKTGRVGHDQHDFSRYRNHMTSSIIYMGQAANSEWSDAICVELPQSFSGDNSFLIAPQSMIRWSYDFLTPLNRKRWPWLVAFMGMNGFTWERGLSAQTLGGESCFTPDYSEALPYFKDMTKEVRALQRGIGKMIINSKPYRSKVAILWSPYNHFISRLLPFQENCFAERNTSVKGGALSDCLSLLNSIRVRPTFVAPKDVIDGSLEKRGFKALFLPYSKGVSWEEADALKKFVKDGGLLIADNEPGTFNQHGRKLSAPLLSELFPDFKKKTIVKYGKGHAVYLPNGINQSA